jgi:hypothetical protein
MQDAIAFLESLGAGLACTPQAYAAGVTRLDVPAEVGDALLRRDPAALNALLGGRAEMWCAIMSPGESPPQWPDGDTPDGDSPDDAPLEEPLRDDPDADRT